MDAPPTLLVVDDNPDNVDLLVRHLRRFGYEDVLTAGSGDVALDLIRSRRIDLVLLDIMMPVMDGYQVLEALQAEGRLTDLPVIVVSALDDIESAVRCIQLGADDHLPKPFNRTLLRARVDAVIEKQRLRGVRDEQRRRLELEAEAARTLQTSMLPTDFPGAASDDPVVLHAVMIPALEVGGDLYDFFSPEPHLLCALVGDVAGKGIAAGMFMARARSLLRWITTRGADPSGTRDLAAIAGLVNAELCEGNAMAMFVTLCIVIVDVRTGVVHLCSAGHNPPYRLAADGSVEAIDVHDDAALGLDEDAVFRTLEITLHAGDALFLYSDGITEARDPDGGFFEEARLEAALRSSAGSDPRQCIDAVVGAVTAFADSRPQADDITALVLRRRT